MIEIEIPESRRSDIVGFVAEMESLTVSPDVAGRVVIDSQSGVIIMGESVRVGKVAVSYRKVGVSVGAFEWDEEETPEMFVIEETTRVNDLIDLLKTVGLETDAVIEILRAIEKAGALFGRLIIL
jgi:flagellar P-ring protein precursor FlgI